VEQVGDPGPTSRSRPNIRWKTRALHTRVKKIEDRSIIAIMVPMPPVLS